MKSLIFHQRLSLRLDSWIDKLVQSLSYLQQGFSTRFLLLLAVSSNGGACLLMVIIMTIIIITIVIITNLIHAAVMLARYTELRANVLENEFQRGKTKHFCPPGPNMAAV